MTPNITLSNAQWQTVEEIMNDMTNFHKTGIDDIMREMQVSRETAREIAEHRTTENRVLAGAWEKNLPSLKARCDEAYETELRRYRQKNPAGKNADKAALRKARAIWDGYRR